TVKQVKNNFTADSGGSYDIQIGFATSPGKTTEFNPGDKIVYTISAPFPITSLDFAQLSQVGNNKPAFYAAAAISTMSGPNWNGQGKIGYIHANSFALVAVPEIPSGLLASVLCLGGLVLGWRRNASLALG